MKSPTACSPRLLAMLFVSVLLNATVIPAANGVIRLEPVLQGLSSPLYVTNAHDGINRLFVVEQPGRIKALPPRAMAPTLFLDIASRVLSPAGSEQGLLGLAFHPQFATNSRFFVNYTRRPDGATVIAEYQAFADPVATAASEIVLLTIAQPYANHNGGMIEFGSDGFLYIGMGDGGSGNDPENRAQNLNELLGKILRIDVDHAAGGLPYASPPGNPYAGATPGRDEIFAVGMRNPFRFSFDRGGTRQLYVGDVGQAALEEVDIVTVGGNYGWRVYEGNQCTNLDPGLCTPTNFVPPIAQYGHTGGRCSITGGYVYRGAAGTLPQGTYVFADFCTGEIFNLAGGVSNVILASGVNVSSFGEDEAGEIYVVGLGGTVHRLAGTLPNAATIALTSSLNPATAGANVTFTAMVGGTNPTGSVNFTDGGVSISGCAAVALTPGNPSIATCNNNSLAVGSHSIMANYSGDGANAASSSAPLAQIITAAAFTNGGFELPNLGGGFQYAPPQASWVFTGAGGISGNGTAFTSGNPAAPEGVQVAFLQGGGQAAQTANIAAGTYTLSIRAAQRGSGQNGTQIVRLQVDGITVGQFQPPNTSYTDYQTPPFTIVGNGVHMVTLTGIGTGGDFTAFIDDVRLTANAAGPSAFVNSGFELPNLAGGFQYAPAGASWVFAGASGISGNGTAFTNGNPSAPEGVQVAFLQGGGQASQTANITAGTYMLSIRAAQRGNGQNGTQIVRLVVDGVTVGQFQPPSTSYIDYQTPPFSIAGGNHMLRLIGVGTGSDFTAFIDDVRLTATVATVPAFINSGFELPNLAGGFEYAPPGATWVFAGAAGISGNGTAFTSGNPPAPEGVQVAFVQGGGQVLQTANIAAGTYTLAIRAAQRGNSQGGIQIVRLQVDGVTVGQFQPPSTSYTDYQTPAFAIAGGNHTLALTGVGSGTDFTAFVDDVRLIRP